MVVKYWCSLYSNQTIVLNKIDHLKYIVCNNAYYKIKQCSKQAKQRINHTKNYGSSYVANNKPIIERENWLFSSFQLSRLNPPCVDVFTKKSFESKGVGVLINFCCYGVFFKNSNIFMVTLDVLNCKCWIPGS